MSYSTSACPAPHLSAPTTGRRREDSLEEPRQDQQDIQKDRLHRGTHAVAGGAPSCAQLAGFDPPKLRRVVGRGNKGLLAALLAWIALKRTKRPTLGLLTTPMYRPKNVMKEPKGMEWSAQRNKSRLRGYSK